MTDQVALDLAALESELRIRLRRSASVERDQDPGFLGELVTVDPVRKGALSVTWIEAQGELILQAGTFGGRWELNYSPASTAFIRKVVDAAIAGQIVEIFSLKRSKVIVTLADGSIVEGLGSEGLLGLLPLPGWSRRGRRVEYRPYVD